MKLKPLGRKIILRPSISEYRGGIAIPETVAFRSSTCKIIERGPCSNPYLQKDMLVFCSSHLGNRNYPLNPEGDFLCSDTDIFAILWKKKIFPIGVRYLIERDVQDHISPGGIITPENRRYQSLIGTVRQKGLLGIHDKFKVSCIDIGSRIHLTEWSENMTELPFEGKYHLIVNEKDILFKWN